MATPKQKKNISKFKLDIYLTIILAIRISLIPFMSLENKSLNI